VLATAPPRRHRRGRAARSRSFSRNSACAIEMLHDFIAARTPLAYLTMTPIAPIPNNSRVVGSYAQRMRDH
jgi:hypothetical protein